MKLFKVFAVLALVLVAAGLFAQTRYPTAKVNVPFEFMAGDMTMPAGDYTIVLVKPHMLRLDGPADSVYINTAHKLPTDQFMIADSKLLFTEANGKHVLHQVWIQGSPHAFDIAHISMTADIP